MAPKILVVLTSADKIPKNNHPTGWYLPEFAHPYDVLSPKAEITVVSPAGGAAPLDPNSVEATKDDPSCVAFKTKHASVWQNTQLLKDYIDRVADFDALFYPGGHGPMFDLVSDPHSIQLIEKFLAAGKPVASVCHGPVVLLNAKGADGEPVVKGKEVTGFSNVEEDMVKMTELMPFLLEDELVKKGGKYVKADQPWGEKVITDGLIITGQNPASAKAVGEAIAKALGI